MKKNVITSIFIFQLTFSFAQNPLITNQFTADPTARVFNGKLYIYPSHDVPCGEEQGFIGFCMPDYHVFSSENLTDWQDHGVILSHNTVPWVEPDSYRMWAPDCVCKDGKYYYYFPARSTEKINGEGRRIGVAIAINPIGPFIPEPNFISGVWGIDPNVFIDKNGEACMYWADNSVIYAARLNDNMLELASVPIPVLINGIGKRNLLKDLLCSSETEFITSLFPTFPKQSSKLCMLLATTLWDLLNTKELS